MRTGKCGISGWLVRRASWLARAVLVDVVVGVLLSGVPAACSSYGYCVPLVSRCWSPGLRRRLRRAVTFCVAAIAVLGAGARS
ncbi:hypothetical protein StrepF001_17830 [Streptomyces sp. F001]|uniref:hypothetical protein n=1 Tax=Streptomyces sp. F001 TaxID=1510026 RepID=UPI00101E78E5|nr:hypothetical protein [Streptomyces sp. F001]RZB17692.1 hypothetical protein StrepF001_17830 [Streptomyces sp. F001]